MGGGGGLRLLTCIWGRESEGKERSLSLSVERGKRMSWRNAPFGLHVRQYAMLICKELRWPNANNVDLIAECIAALSDDGDMRRGFVKLMEAVTEAKLQEIRVCRWFFQDGKYNDITLPEVAPSLDFATPATPELFRRKPN